MRKGSSKLGSLGVILRRASVPCGIALLILPLYASTSAVVTPAPGWAQETVAQNTTSDKEAVRDALTRRGSDWLSRANAKVKQKRVAAAKPLKKTAAKTDRDRVLRVINTRATWYGPGFHGRRTASGERFNQNAMTMASRHLPFGTRVRVTNPRNGKSAIARVNDRGPFRGGYTADLSKGLAKRIGLLGNGPVRIEILSKKK